jgi:hypothetical protein
MLGPPKPRRLGEPIAVSLEELVPPRNFYRHLEAKLDLSAADQPPQAASPHRHPL